MNSFRSGERCAEMPWADVELLPNKRLQLTGRGVCRAAALAGGLVGALRRQLWLRSGPPSVYGRRTAAGS